MTRERAAGLIIVVLALMAAVVIIPTVAGRTVPGVAQATPVPGPPVVGECIAGRFDLSWDMPGTDPAKYRYPELALNQCSQAHYGEVVSVIAAPITPKFDVDPGGASMSIDDENIFTCSQAAWSFFSSAPPGNAASILYGYWSIGLATSVVPMTPTVRQRAAGEHWLACATYLTDESVSGGTTLIQYQGTLRSALSTGAGRDYLGHCPTESDWNQMTSSACRRPHHGETFGVGGLLSSTSRATLTASCAKLVAQITKNATLTRDGRLTVDVQATDSTGNTVNGSNIPARATAQCGVSTTGGRLLNGSLIAIGSAPIPWT